MAYQNRNEIPLSYKWNTDDLYPNDDAFEKDFQKLVSESKNVLAFRALKNGEDLYHALDEMNRFSALLEHLYVYAYLKADEDVRNTFYQEKKMRLQALDSEYEKTTSFFIPKIKELGQEKINEFLKEYEPLRLYQHYFDELFRLQDHYLDEEKEKIITSLTKNNSSLEETFEVLLNGEIDFGKIKVDGTWKKITRGNIPVLLRNKDRSIRKKVYELAGKAKKQHANTFGNLLSMHMGNTHEEGKIRGFHNVMERAFLVSDIPLEVHDTLYKVAKRRKQSFQNWFLLRKKIMNLPKLYPYDLYTDLFAYEKKISVEEAQLMVMEGLSPLGSEYQRVLREAFHNRWLDYYDYQGRHYGGYCIGESMCHPYVLINFDESLKEVMTMAHECGHAINYHYFFGNNPYVYASQDSIVAEVASLTNEVLMANYFIQKKDKLATASIIESLIDTIENNLFNACLEGELETICYQKLSNGEILNRDVYSDIILRLYHEYYGKTISETPYLATSWTSRGHYYQPFYLYKYATSICAAIYMAKKILDQDEEALASYMEFLKMGRTCSPLEILKVAGIDLLDETVYEEAIDYFDYLVQTLEQLYEEGEN